MIHGNVLVKIHGEIKKNDKNELHLQNAQCFKIALYEMLALKFKGVVMLFIENSYFV
jgi:molybdopterin biosynthesis enzyme